MAGDDDAAAASGSLLVVAVLGADAGFGADVLQDLAVLVFADAADVDGGVGGEDILRVKCALVQTRLVWGSV